MFQDLQVAGAANDFDHLGYDRSCFYVGQLHAANELAGVGANTGSSQCSSSRTRAFLWSEVQCVGVHHLGVIELALNVGCLLTRRKSINVALEELLKLLRHHRKAGQIKVATSPLALDFSLGATFALEPLI